MQILKAKYELEKVDWDARVLPFHAYCNSIISSPETVPNWVFEPNPPQIDMYLPEGKAILRYQEIIDKQHCKDYAYSAKIMGLKAVVMNTADKGSGLFKSFSGIEDCEIMCVYCYSDKLKKWKCSIYSTKSHVDCGAIAKNYGGGGHKGAAGFEIPDLEFIKKC